MRNIHNHLSFNIAYNLKTRKTKEKYYYISYTAFIGLAYEGISSILHYKRQKALHKVIQAMENKVDLQNNKIFHLEDSMVMYDIYNSDNLEALVDTVYRLHNQSTWNEKLFAGQIEVWYHWYLSAKGIIHYAINFIAFPGHHKRKICKNVMKDSLIN